MSKTKQHEQACGCQASVKRRTVLQGMAFAGAASVLPGGAFAQGQASDAAPEDMLPQEGDHLVAERTNSTTPLTVEDIDSGRLTQAWAMSPDGTVRNGVHEHLLVMIKFDPSKLGETTTEKAAEGVVAYSAICTHQGCTVQQYVPDLGTIECPCHGSHFIPTQNGEVKYGPAQRNLPSLKLAVADDGTLTVAEGFSSRLGGG